jgi:very-short-patch-repair endonuclease
MESGEAVFVVLGARSKDVAARRDFACTKVRLVVEVDGPYHEDRDRPDARRDRALAERGWHVLRVADHLVFQDLDAVVDSIVANGSALRR